MRYRCCNLIHNLITGFPPDPNPPDPPELLPLVILFNDILNNNIVADPSDVAEWNSAIVASGTGYTSVVVNGNEVSLYGGVGVTLTGNFSFNTELLIVDDQAEQVIGFTDGLFAGSTITYASLNACTSIPDFGFGQCTSLNTVEIDSATSIGNVAFQGTIISAISCPVCTFIDEQAFLDCSSLVTASFPICTEVVSGGFGNCTGMTTCTMPNVEILGTSAFSGCTALTVFVANNLTTCTGAGQFSGCSSLVSLSFASLLSAGNGFCAGCVNLQTFTAPLCTAISSAPLNGFFQDCSSLNNVNLSSCINFGGTVGDDDVFVLSGGATLTLTCTITVPVLLQTCNGGNPDGDLADLVANNPGTITINYV